MSNKLKGLDDNDMPEWKKKHIAEQERRAREAEAEKEAEQQREAAKLQQLEQAAQQAEQERLRLAAEAQERRKREDEEEMRKKAEEAKLRMQQFSGAAAKAERDKILEEEGILKKKSVTGLGSPRGPQPQPIAQEKKPAETTGNVPEWKRKKMEQEAAEKKRLEEEARAKQAKLASLEPVFEVK